MVGDDGSSSVLVNGKRADRKGKGEERGEFIIGIVVIRVPSWIEKLIGLDERCGSCAILRYYTLDHVSSRCTECAYDIQSEEEEEEDDDEETKTGRVYQVTNRRRFENQEERVDKMRWKKGGIP
ncbi:hypothetical protein M0804_002597 [Polistes exclamans]|nr:hypothetical protein M0804_002597 [Polistes exclamans]